VTEWRPRWTVGVALILQEFAATARAGRNKKARFASPWGIAI
jgi:hypothetical protein